MVAKFKKKRKPLSLKNVLLSFFMTFLLLGTIVFLAATNWKIFEKRADLKAKVGQLEEQVLALENKNQELKDNISYAQSQDYLEEAARDKLGLKKPGEEVIVVQKESSSAEASENKEKNDWWEIIKSWWPK